MKNKKTFDVQVFKQYVNEQLARTPKELPTLFIAVNKKIVDF
jgi:thymidylate synthase